MLKKRMKVKYFGFFCWVRREMGKFTASVLALLLVFIPLLSLTLGLFTTPSKVFAIGTAVDLGTAEDFAVLAGSAITDSNPPAGMLTGDVGLGPAAGTFITGLTSGQVSGTIYAVDDNGPDGVSGNNPGLIITAQTDLGLAYDDAAGQASDFAVDASTTDSFAGTGYTLEPGVYTSGSTMGITGTLTLDGGGDPDAVFIFQAGSSLTTATDSEVVLTNSAQACNVFWQVGSSATLGTTSTFLGTIMAVASITDDGGSTIEGRLLADADENDTGAVTLNNTTISVPTCATATPTPTTTVAGSSSGSSGTSSAFCPALSEQTVAPTVIDSKRVDADSIYISWAPYSGTDKFNVQYGTENGKWLYNVDVTGFSITINALPLNQPIWVRVAARNDCRIGTYGESKLVGGPGLPSTGFAPRGDNTPWYLLAGISMLFVFLFKRTHA